MTGKYSANPPNIYELTFVVNSNNLISKATTKRTYGDPATSETTTDEFEYDCK